MRRLLKYTTLILMVLMFSGTVWAFNYTDHITTAPNNKGDVLIYPWFLALDGGWQTKLTVINTDEVNSVVAKLIIRSFKNSEELLDFFLYLSPADVWTGAMKYDSALGKVVIFSDDDSAIVEIIPSVEWASPAKPINQPMFALACPDDADYLGYIEVITAAAGPVAPAKPGVAKDDIYAAYADLVLNGPTATNPLDFAGNYIQGERINVLAGYMQLMNPVSGLDASLRATNLKDYGNTEALSTGKETRLGMSAALNDLAEVEAALSKDDIAMPYVKGDDIALHFFTFPTKLTLGCDEDAWDSPYFNDLGANCVPYKVITYDLTEKYPLSGSPFSGGSSTTLKFCDEVNFLLSTAFQYAEGWAHYYFKPKFTADLTESGAQLSYDGTPVLPTYLYLGTTGLSANYGAWTDTLVYCSSVAGTSLIDYQYTDSAPGICVGN